MRAKKVTSTNLQDWVVIEISETAHNKSYEWNHNLQMHPTDMHLRFLTMKRHDKILIRNDKCETTNYKFVQNE